MAEESYHRRRLPHWRETSAVYFVTWRVADDQPELSVTERDAVASALKAFDGNRYVLLAFVVMNGHVHVLLDELKGHSLEKIVHSWKSYTANQLQRAHGRIGRVWQDEFFDRIVRDKCEFDEKIDYAPGNPIKRWPEIVAYRWVWVREEP